MYRISGSAGLSGRIRGIRQNPESGIRQRKSGNFAGFSRTQKLQ
jgi:hypothetical protein